MFSHKHHIFFPLLVALLSLGLLVFMFYAFAYTSGSPKDVQPEPASISTDEYRASLHVIVTAFDQSPALQARSTNRLAGVDAALNSLLALRVPPESQRTHLELALTLSSMKDRIARNEDINELLEKWQAQTAEYK